MSKYIIPLKVQISSPNAILDFLPLDHMRWQGTSPAFSESRDSGGKLRVLSMAEILQSFPRRLPDKIGQNSFPWRSTTFPYPSSASWFWSSVCNIETDDTGYIHEEHVIVNTWCLLMPVLRSSYLRPPNLNCGIRLLFIRKFYNGYLKMGKLTLLCLPFSFLVGFSSS